MATECLLSRVTQLFLHPEAPLLFFPLLITIATASSMNIPTLASPLVDQPIASVSATIHSYSLLLAIKP